MCFCLGIRSVEFDLAHCIVMRSKLILLISRWGSQCMLRHHRHDCFYIKRLTMFLQCQNSTSTCKHSASSGFTLSDNVFAMSEQHQHVQTQCQFRIHTFGKPCWGFCVCRDQKHWAANLTHNVPCKFALACSLRTHICCLLHVESYFYFSAHIWNKLGTCNPDKPFAHVYLLYDQTQTVVNLRVRVQETKTECSSDCFISMLQGFFHPRFHIERYES